MKKKISAAEIQRRINQRQAQWEKDNPDLVIRREQMHTAFQHHDRHKGTIRWIDNRQMKLC